jgi:D-sedoheptulose 7-phosphate isomerase
MSYNPLNSAADLANYSARLQAVLAGARWYEVAQLAAELHACLHDRRQVFLCGNGGSAANAMHIANDLLFGISRGRGPGLRVAALPSNPSVITCLANDIGYDQIFAAQLAVHAQAGDVLIALSGSGNSPNIIEALKQGMSMRLRTFAILGYSGGKAKALADIAIHFPVDDMQISEDLQMVVGHMVMQHLCKSSQTNSALDDLMSVAASVAKSEGALIG